MNIDELSDRELDAMVARRVFGLQVEKRVSIDTGNNDYFQLSPSGQDWVQVPTYSTASDMAAALTLEVELKRLGWRRVAPSWKIYGGKVLIVLGMKVEIILRHNDGRTVHAFGLVNEALCRAALKAVTLT